MKNFCDKIMKINIDFPYGTDYSGIALLLYLLEKKFWEHSEFETSDFLLFLYRFYADNRTIREKHYHKMINNIFHYVPQDFQKYINDILVYIEDNYDLIVSYNEYFYIKNLPEIDKKSQSIISKIISLSAAKYLGEKNKSYTSILAPEEFEQPFFQFGTRVFNRAIEKNNICFICQETNLENLCAVRICDDKNNISNIDNYLLLCKQHANMYIENNIKIKRNGYAYLNGEKMLNHLDIFTLKKIRKFLSY